jgi:hypothetical protein
VGHHNPLILGADLKIAVPQGPEHGEGPGITAGGNLVQGLLLDWEGTLGQTSDGGLERLVVRRRADSEETEKQTGNQEPGVSSTDLREGRGHVSGLPLDAGSDVRRVYSAGW